MNGKANTIGRVRLAPGKTLVEQLGTGGKTTASGLILADQEGTDNARNRFEGRVLAIGAMEWRDDRGELRSVWYAVEDRIVVASYNPCDLWLEGYSWVIIDSDDVAAVIDRTVEEASHSKMEEAVAKAMEVAERQRVIDIRETLTDPSIKPVAS